MFSTPNKEWDEYLRRLHRPLQSLPPDARAEAQQELRQHLDALVAAQIEQGATEEEAVRAAMRSFGDPARVSRRLAGEWRFQHTRNAACGVQYFLIPRLVVSLLASIFYQWQGHYIHANPTANPNFALERIVWETFVVLVSSLVVGWFAPGSAFRVAFYGWLALSGLTYVEQLATFWRDISSFHNGHFYQKQGPFTIEIPLLGPIAVLATFAAQCGVAYLVSAYRRGAFYALRRADFRIPLLWLYRKQKAE